jgi:uncharacterized membrane protein YqjE
MLSGIACSHERFPLSPACSTQGCSMALRQVLADLSINLTSVIRTRLELFSLEAAQQRDRLLQLLALGLVTLVFALVGLLVLSVAVALLFWPTDYRYLALFVMALVYLLLSLGLFLVLRHRLRFDTPPFSATLAELQYDMALLQRLKEPAQAAVSDKAEGA